MTFNDLTPGALFSIDGTLYEAKLIGERIVIGYPCAELASGKRVYISDPEDLTGYHYLTDCFSDLRVNRNNATPEELQAEKEAADLW